MTETDVKTRLDEDEQELQALVDSDAYLGCGVVGCVNTHIDPRGPVHMRDQHGATTSYHVCDEHFEMIFLIVGQSVGFDDDTEDDEPGEVLFGDERLAEAIRNEEYDEEEWLDEPIFE